MKYKLLLCVIFFLEHDFNAFNKSFSKTFKYLEKNLMNLKKIKKLITLCFF